MTKKKKPSDGDHVLMLWRALQESVRLQSHYATLLNIHDGGKRKTFSGPQEWIDRLKEIG